MNFRVKLNGHTQLASDVARNMFPKSVAFENVNVCLVPQVGAVADVTLWDLSSLALLPKTDPLSLLILGSRTQAVGAGSTLTDSWVRLFLVHAR